MTQLRVSAKVTLATALSVLHRLFAPVMPFVTEEVWSWWRVGIDSLGDRGQPPTEFTQTGPMPVTRLCSTQSALPCPGIRRAKSDAKVSMRTDVQLVEISGPDAAIEHVRAAKGDLNATGRVEELRIDASNEPLRVLVTF